MALPRLKKNNTITGTIYTDFTASFEKNPISNDVIVKSDVNAVKESIKNILLTDRGSRLLNPYFGCGIRAMLFENKYSPAINQIVEEEVISTINNYEPRAVVESVECISSMDDNIMRIIIYFYVRNVAELQTTTITMERVR